MTAAVPKNPEMTVDEYRRADGPAPGVRTGGDAIEAIQNQPAVGEPVPAGRQDVPIDFSKMA